MRLDNRRPRFPLKIIFEGDSLTSGSGIPATDSYPSQLMAEFAGTDVVSESFASELATLSEVISSRAPKIDAAYDSARTNVLLLWAGTNDLKILGLTGRQTYDLYASYVSGRLARGYVVMPFTILPRWNPQTPESFEPERQAFNALVRANKPPHIVDVASDRRIGEPNACFNKTYFFNGTHMLRAGYTIVKDLAFQQLMAV